MTSLSAFLVLATFGLDVPADVPGATPPDNLAKAEAEASCSKYGERNSGVTRICYYDCRGTMAEISVPSARLCPF